MTQSPTTSCHQHQALPIKVGIVDDHAAVTHAFGMLFNAMPGIRTVLETYSGQELLQQLETIPELPDILLVDVLMEDMDGIETTRKVTALYPTIKIIALSGNKDDYSIIRMINAGACAYLAKNVLPKQLEQAIREVDRHGKYQADLYHTHTPEFQKYRKEIGLLTFPENEKRYLQLLSKGYLYAQIAQEMGVTVEGVNYFHTSLARKLKTKNMAQMVLTAIRIGIISLHEPTQHH